MLCCLEQTASINHLKLYVSSLYCVEMYGKKLQEIQKIISEFVTVIKFKENVMTKMAFHRLKNVWTQCYQNTHLSLKIICLNEKAQNTLYSKQKFTYILVLKGSEKTITDYMFTCSDNGMVQTESENRHLLTCTLNRND